MLLRGAQWRANWRARHASKPLGHQTTYTQGRRACHPGWRRWSVAFGSWEVRRCCPSLLCRRCEIVRVIHDRCPVSAMTTMKRKVTVVMSRTCCNCPGEQRWRWGSDRQTIRAGTRPTDNLAQGLTQYDIHRLVRVAKQLLGVWPGRSVDAHPNQPIERNKLRTQKVPIFHVRHTVCLDTGSPQLGLCRATLHMQIMCDLWPTTSCIILSHSSVGAESGGSNMRSKGHAATSVVLLVALIMLPHAVLCFHAGFCPIYKSGLPLSCRAPPWLTPPQSCQPRRFSSTVATSAPSTHRST